ncbi:MAG: RHS repeat-associated core domain-containing protein [Firmicutes bacterium]|nr:RHS repeat-associated core domain-containing protein [Bacillota bacterium]
MHSNTLLGDAIDPHVGTLSFQHTDVSLPGNSGLAVALVRELSPGYFHGLQENVEFGDWNYAVPRLSVVSAKGTMAVPNQWTGQRCTNPLSTFSPVLYNAAEQFTVENTAFPVEYSNGLMLSAPGYGSQHVLIQSPNQVQPFPQDARFVTASGWYLMCGSASDGGEGFIAVAPNGDRYRFDRYILRNYANLGTLNAAGENISSSAVLERVKAQLMATEVTDAHGNWVRYDYDTLGRLTRIYANDSRELTLQYASDSQIVTSVTANGRVWLYEYTTHTVSNLYAGDYSTNKRMLSKVIRPDGTYWEFDTYPMYQRPASGRRCASVGGTVSITHPNGVRGEFVIAETHHRFGIAEWETVLTNRCLGTPSYTRDPTFYDIYNRPQRAMSVQSKTLSAVDIPTAVWTYTYESDIEEERYPVGHPMAGHPIPTSGDNPTNWTKVLNPDGSETTYYHYWTNLESTTVSDIYSGKLVRQEERSAPTGDVLETIDFHYVSTSFFGGSYIPWNYPLGPASNILRPRSSARHVQLSSVIQSRDGDTFTTDYQYQTDQSSSAYSFGKPTEVRTFSNVSTTPRVRAVTYTHNTTLWILGLPTTVTVNDRLTDSYDYLPNGQLHRHFRYGALYAEYSYYVAGPAAGSIKTIQDGLSRTTELLDWMRGIPQQIKRPDGTSVYQNVNDNGWISSTVDARGNVTEFNYDVMGRLTQINSPSPWENTVLHYDWSGPGVVQTITRGHQRTQVTYDSMFRPRLELTRALDTGWSSYVNRTYDAMGRMVFQSQPSSSQAESNGIDYTYDGLGRITHERETVAPYAETRHTYLSLHRHRVYDPQDFYVDYYSYGYDGPGSRDYREIRHSIGVRTEFTKNIWGELTRLRQRGTQNGFTVDQSRYYYYDAQRRVCREYAPELGTTHYQYDAAGQLTAYAKGQTNSGCSVANSNARVNLTYDAMGRLANTNYVDAATPNIQRTYDADGNLLSISRAGVVWDYTYNNLNLLTAEQLTVDGRPYDLFYQYNNAGHLTQRTLPSGRVVQYSLDGLGRQQGVQADGHAVLSQVGYHPSGQVTAMTYGNGQQFTQTLNARLLPASIHSAAGDHVALHQTFTYDARANLTQINDLTVAGNSRMNTYDGMNRLVSASGPWGNGSFVYDALGNLRQKTLGARTVTLHYDGQNRLTGSVDSGWSGTRDFAYDARGNVTTAGQLQFVYDRSEQPVAITGAANGIGSADGSYRYDGHFKRVQQEVNGNTVYSVYDRAGVLVHIDAVTANELTDYLVGPQGTLARIKNNDITYLHPDILGSAQSGTDSSGAVQWREQYSPFGEELQGISANENQAGYTGHIRDAATGLNYMQARYYDPVVGRFYSNDPVGFKASNPMMFNRYAYANNNPYKFVDPDGRNPVAGAAAGCAVSGPACPAGAVVGAVIGAVLGVAGVIAYNEISSDGPAAPDTETGKEPDPADKGGELTKSGRAGQKHGSREGSAFPPATGNADNKNSQGQAILEGIVNNPDSTSERNQRGGTDVYSPDGKGARFDQDGKFTGFLEPKIEK